MTTPARPAAPAIRRVVRWNVAAVAALHVAALTLFLGGHLLGTAGLAMIAFAYSRGLLHALDADHLAMIDGSTRKLLGEQRNPAGVGLAFSLGHSTVVLAAGVAVVLGAAWVREAIDPDTQLATVLGSIGAGVSAAYLLAVAAANTPLLVAAVRGADAVGHTHALAPTGWWGRLLMTPLSRARHAGHVYAFGLLFGLGFDTASTISLLMLTASASPAGVPPVALLCLPLAFAAAMTLGDSINAHVMLRVYTAAETSARRRLNIALLIVSITSAVLVAGATLTGLVGAWTGIAVPEFDTTWFGWGLAALAALGALWLGWLRFLARRAGPHPPLKR